MATSSAPLESRQGRTPLLFWYPFWVETQPLGITHDGSSQSQNIRFKHPPSSRYYRVFKTTFDIFTGVGPNNSLERLTERSVGFVTYRPSDVYELVVTLL